MKIIKIVVLLISLVFLVGCQDEKTPMIDDNTETEPVVTEPDITEPVDEPFRLSIVGGTTDLEISSDDFETMNPSELIIKVDEVSEETYSGYRVMLWLTELDNPAEGFILEGLHSLEYVSKDLSSIYLVTGKKVGDEVIDYAHEDYFLARFMDSKMTKVVENPIKITLRSMNLETAIYYINYSSITGRYDYHTSLRAMQGIINRHAPRLLTLSNGNPYFKESDQTWLNVLEDDGYDLIELTSLEEVIYTFKSSFNGIITFKDRFKSYNNWVSGESDFALMMASLMDYAPLPFGIQQAISNLTGLEIIDQFEVNGHVVLGDISAYLDSKNITSAYDCYALVFNEFKEAFNTESYMSLTSEVMDYAASKQMMFFDLKATQSERDHLLSRSINQYFDQNNLFFQVYGWVDHESSALDFISSYGGIIDVVGSGNLSLISQLKSENTSFTQKAVDDAIYDTTKKYVTFFASESDTIKVGIAFQHGAWLDPNRGKVKINWGLISDMSYEFPYAYEYFIQTASKNDYFYSGGGSAIGFVDIDSQMHYLSREAIADQNKYSMTIADQQFIDMYNDKYTSSDLYEESVLGSYLKRSGVQGAFSRMHDGNTAIRIEEWTGVPVYNRWTNFYPRRASSNDVLWSSLDTISSNHYQQDVISDYWFIQATLANTQKNITFDIFTQENGDSYQIVFQDGEIKLQKNQSGVVTVLMSKIYSTTSRQIKLSVDHSTPLDTHTRIKLYVNDLKIFEFYDVENTFTQGGFALKSEESTKSVITNLDGTKYSMAKQIYNRIISDTNHYILAYYGFVGTEDYTNAQYRTEPGIGGVISLSPTDFYKIQLLLDLHYPGVYEIVNAREFMQFAKQYQQYYGTLR